MHIIFPRMLTSIIVGHLRAMYSLGEMNAEGIGVKRNCNYAVEVNMRSVHYAVTK